MTTPGSALRNVTGRRGIFAGLAAVVAAGLAKLGTPDRAQAGHNTNIAYDSQTVMHLDVTNTTVGSSRISSNISGTAAFVALNNYPVGISRPDGMLGRTAYTTSNCAGVAGTCEAASGGLGVMGAAKASNGTGVYGYAGSVVPSTIAPGGTGVYGSGPNYGLYGTTSSGVGVLGQTSSNIGVYGSAAGAAWGVYGFSPSGVGVYGDVSVGGYAGYFNGDVGVLGAFTVMGGPKSAGVPFPDGTIHRMYCQESPEPWFEDFGRATLAAGHAEITIDPDFLSIVKGDDYDVFLTPYGDSKGLFVKKGQGRFTVLEQQGGTSNLEFGYRVVARRRDNVGKRLEQIDPLPPRIKNQVTVPVPEAPASTPPTGGQQPRSVGDLSDDPVK